MVLHTPIPYWLSLPWAETCTWSAKANQVQAEDAGHQ
jgi:hypothetical protein